MTPFNPSYVGARPEIIEHVPVSVHSILDVGCSSGALGNALKLEQPERRVVGIEIDAAMAAEAGLRLDRVFCADVSGFNWDSLAGEQFDCIIFADVLEHVPDPWAVLREAVNYLSPGGIVVVSMPNVRHFTVFYWVFIRGKWPMNSRGVFDKTHLRWFTLDSLHGLLTTSSLQIRGIKRMYRLKDKPSRINNQVQRYFGSTLDKVPIIREWMTYQYIVVAGLQP